MVYSFKACQRIHHKCIELEGNLENDQIFLHLTEEETETEMKSLQKATQLDDT